MGGIGMSSKLPSMMMNELLAPFTSANVALLMIHGVATDSRLVRPGYLFFALQGVTQHGLDFVQDALTRGAIAIVVEQGTALEGMSVPVVEVENLNQKLGHIASRFFGEPSRQLILIGITGTNGKTSCSHLMAQCLEESGQRCGILHRGTFVRANPGRPCIRKTVSSSCKSKSPSIRIRKAPPRSFSLENDPKGLATRIATYQRVSVLVPECDIMILFA